MLKNGIPKTVMQTWKTDEVPEMWKAGQLSVKEHFSGWTYVFLNDLQMYDFVSKEYPQFYDAFCALPYSIQRADILRYLWLYSYGGLYLDLDFKVLRSFEAFVSSCEAELMVVHSSNVSSVLTNSIILAKPKIQVLYDIVVTALNNRSNRSKISKHLHVMITTGPMAFHKALNQASFRGTYLVLPRSLFLPYSTVLENHEPVDLQRVFTVPLEGGSWNSTDTLVLNAANKHKYLITAIVLLAIVFYIIKNAEINLAFRNLVQTTKKLFKRRKAVVPQELNFIV